MQVIRDMIEYVLGCNVADVSEVKQILVCNQSESSESELAWLSMVRFPVTCRIAALRLQNVGQVAIDKD